MIDRPERPSSIVRPEPDSANSGQQAAPAGRAVDRAQGGAALVRASQWIKRRNAPPTLPANRSLTAPGFIRGVGGVDPVARSLRSPELHRRARNRKSLKRIPRKRTGDGGQPPPRRLPAGGSADHLIAGRSAVAGSARPSRARIRRE